MVRGKVVRITASIEYLSPEILTPSHPLTHPTEAFKLAKVKAAHPSRRWPYPPALACKDYVKDNNIISYKLFDSHHRTHAALLRGRKIIPVYTFPYDQYRAVVDRYFKGVAPKYYSKLDRYIILPDGRTYRESGIRR